MFKIENISKIYKSKEGITVNALSDVSIDFGNKGLVFVLGKSGSGKSTLLNILGGLDTPTSGELIINRRSSSTFSGSDFDDYRNTYVGIVFQEYNLIENYTVGANIGLALELQGKSAERSQVDKILKEVGLADSTGVTLYNRKVNELSGGQRQRVAIARALIKDPEIILADEPTGALDNKTGESLYELFKELSKEKLIIVVTHDRESAIKYGDKIIELADGEVVSEKEISPKVQNDELTKDCNFIKSKLPFRHSFKLGVRALKVKPMRLVSIILLSIITFTTFNLLIVASSTNWTLAELNMLNQNHQNVITITGHACDSSNVSVAFDKTLTARQIDTLKKYNNGNRIIKVKDTSTNFLNYLEESVRYSLGIYERKYERIISLMSPKLVELNPETGEKDINLIPDSRFINRELCHLPRTASEIAITDLFADLFITYGYLPYNREEPNLDTKVIKIYSPDDLIGREFGGYTICGVYSTEQNLEEYKNRYNNDTLLSNGMIFGAASSCLTYSFICEDDKSTCDYGTSVLVKLSGDIIKDSSLIKDLTYKIGSNTYTTVRIRSAYSGLISQVSFMNGYLFRTIMTDSVKYFV